MFQELFVVIADMCHRTPEFSLQIEEKNTSAYSVQLANLYSRGFCDNVLHFQLYFPSRLLFVQLLIRNSKRVLQERYSAHWVQIPALP